VASHSRLPRVLFAIGSLATGGSENQLVELLARAHRRAVDATVVTWDPEVAPGHRERLAEAGVEHLTLAPLPPRPLYHFATFIRVSRLLRRLRPDAAYPWLEQSSFYVAPLCRARGIPVAVARRNISGAEIERVRLAAFAIRRAERLASVVTANSEAVATAAVRRGVAPERIRLVRNGHEQVPPLPPPAAEPVVLGYVARFRAEKGHSRLLDALSRVRAHTPWRIDLAGDGATRERVQAEVTRRGLDERVRFVGPAANVREFWRDRAVAVLLSDHEGSPNALIEAAFAGRALLGTSVGGIPEIVSPSGGLLVSPDDPDGIAESITRLIDDETLRVELGSAAQRQAVERFSMSAFVQGHLAAIDEALESNRRWSKTSRGVVTPGAAVPRRPQGSSPRQRREE
jgi:glycosyltransferase involved in cell wall biosynthesis